MAKPNPFIEKENVDAQAELINFYIDEINEWFLDNAERFDSSFFESLEMQWSEKSWLSDKQFEALKNIYEKWVE